MEVVDPVNNTFTPRIYFSRANITINGNNSAETFTLDNPSGSPGLINLVVNGGIGNDTFNVLSTAAGVTTLVNGRAGSKTVTVGSAGSVQNVQGPLSLNNTGGNIGVQLDDSTDAGSRTATVTAGSIVGLSPGAISVASLRSLRIDEGTGSNTVTIAGTPTGVPVQLNTGTGSNVASVQGTGSGSTLTVQGQSAVDTVVAGGPSGVQNIAGPVNVANSNGITNLTIDDGADGTPRTFSVDVSQVSGLAPAQISYANLGSLTVYGGSGGNTVTVVATPGGIPTVLGSGTGADSVTVLATGAGGSLTVNGQAGVDTVTLGNAGNLDQILGPVTVNNPLGSTNLIVDSSAASSAQTITLNSTQVAGAAPAAVTYANVSTLTVKGGPGADTFQVTPSSATSFSVDGGAPDPPASPGDTLRVSLAGTTGASLTATLTATGYQGTWAFGNRQPVDFSRMETLIPNNSTTTITSNNNPAAAGQSVTFLATVSGSAGTPTGSVTFKDGSATLGTVPLSGGAATFSTSTLTVGSHNITAVYGGDANFNPSTSVTLSQIVQGVTAGRYTPLSPYRLLDTRQTSPMGPNSTLDVTVAGTGGPGGVPSSGASAVVVNITVAEPTDYSYVTIYPSGGSGRPVASNLNFGPGQQRANLSHVALGPDGHVILFNAVGVTHVILDVQGWFSATASPGPAGLLNVLPNPTRILDTRTSLGGHPFQLGPDSILDLQVTGAPPLPPNPGAAAAVLNVTASQCSKGSYLTVYPAGMATPLASNVNFPPYKDVPNRVVVQLNSAGRITIYNSQGSLDVVVDLIGWFTDSSDPAAGGAAFHPLAPARILDTRPSLQVGPYSTPFGPDQARLVPVSGFGGVASNATVVVANVTAVLGTATSFLTIYPSGSGRPLSSDLNMSRGDIVPNLAVSKLGPDGNIQIYNAQGSVDVVVDVAGWYG
jgi:serine protease